MSSPRSLGLAHLAPHARNQVYVGAGPRLSIDQKINFVNENNCLAKRIIAVGNRQAYLSGLLDGPNKAAWGRQRNSLGRNSRSASRSRGSLHSASYVRLPGLHHKVGSLNGRQRQDDFNQITRFNLVMAKKLIDTKAVISFDDQMKHTRKVSSISLCSNRFIFLSATRTQEDAIKRQDESGALQHARQDGQDLLQPQRSLLRHSSEGQGPRSRQVERTQSIHNGSCEPPLPEAQEEAGSCLIIIQHWQQLQLPSTPQEHIETSEHLARKCCKWRLPRVA